MHVSLCQLMSVTQLCFDDFKPEKMKHGKKERVALAPFESMQNLLRQQLGRSKAFRKMVVATVTLHEVGASVNCVTRVSL